MAFMTTIVMSCIYDKNLERFFNIRVFYMYIHVERAMAYSDYIDT